MMNQVTLAPTFVPGCTDLRGSPFVLLGGELIFMLRLVSRVDSDTNKILVSVLNTDLWSFVDGDCATEHVSFPRVRRLKHMVRCSTEWWQQQHRSVEEMQILLQASFPQLPTQWLQTCAEVSAQPDPKALLCAPQLVHRS